LLEEEIARGFGHKDVGHFTHLQKLERGLFVSVMILSYLSTWQFYVELYGDRKNICGEGNFLKKQQVCN